MQQKFGLVLGSLFGMCGVILGAFGAHLLETALATRNTTAVWETAVDYHMWHALALVLCALVPRSGLGLRIAVSLFTIGILLFSGSLYWLALDGPSWLGPITPLGGLSLIAGWATLAIVFCRSNPGTSEA